MSKLKEIFGWVLPIVIVIGVFGYNYYSDQQEEILKQKLENDKKLELLAKEEERMNEQLSKSCKYDLAYKTAVNYLWEENFNLIKLTMTTENPSNCSIEYYFDVRLIKFNEYTREDEFSDKVYQLRMELKKYNDFYGIELAELIDKTNNKYRKLL
ncbi:hypothetical protein ACS126_16405 [Sphingobacterium lactis]|uniref:hypothetical protein n=1 Tax=Sphingobacterium lactis TaxID=797291 RepID=UPI003EC5E93C